MKSFRWKADTPREKAFYLSSLFGFIGIFEGFADAGAAGLAGLYFARLGFGAGAAGLLTGVWIFSALALRRPADLLPDLTERSRIPPFLGYGTLAAVPLLAAAQDFFFAFVLVLLYGAGAAVRRTYRRRLLLRADEVLGSSLGSKLRRSMAGLGALAGCLLLALLLRLAESGRNGDPLEAAFAFLWFPSVLAVLGLAAAYKLGADDFLKVSVPEAEKPRDPSRTGKLLGTAFFFFHSGLGLANPVIMEHSFAGAAPAWGILLAFAAGLGSYYAASHLFDKLPGERRKWFLFLLPPLAVSLPLLYRSGGPAALLVFPVWGLALGLGRGYLFSVDRKNESRLFPIVLGAAFALGSSLIGFLSEVSFDAVFIYVCTVELSSLPMLLLLVLRSGRGK